MPIPQPNIKKPEGALTEDETAFILTSNLRPHHREDPNVLRFISNYMRCRDSKQAAKECGLHPMTGVALRNKTDIHNTIEALTRKSAMKFGYDASEVIERAKEVSSVDPVELMRPDGSYVESLSEVPPEVRRAIKKFEVKNLYERDANDMPVITGKIMKVEFWDKMKAIELLGREKQVFKETKTVQHDVSDKMANILLAGSRNAEKAWEAIDVTPMEQLGPGVTDETT